MPDFDWREYLVFADHAMTNMQHYPVSHEAMARIAISRAYYAAHNRARDWYSRNHGISVSHSRLINHLLSLPTRNLQKIGNDLDNLRNQRNRADYDGRAPGLQESAPQILQAAERVLRATTTS